MKQVKTVAIIGVGLIGGSIGMALKKQTGPRSETSPKASIKIIGIGRHSYKLNKALELKAVDEITTDFCEGVKNADLVIIATPVDIIGSTVMQILPCLKKGCIITDVGSVKSPVVDEVEKIIYKKPLFFIGGHPMAGSEQKGIDVANAAIFNQSVCILTPSKKSSPQALKTVQNLWQEIGVKVIKMPPSKHDQIVSFTSHLPHILASSLVDIVNKLDKNDQNVSLMTAGSFRDLTRVASSDPLLWSGICLQNRKQILVALKKFNLALKQIEELIRLNNKTKLLKKFLNSKEARDTILKINSSLWYPTMYRRKAKCKK